MTVRLSIAIAAVGLQTVKGSVNDDASPIEVTFDLVDLERHPRVMHHDSQLGSGRRAAIHPAVRVHVRNRLDANAIVKRVSKPADMLSLQELDRLGARQFEKLRTMRASHCSSR